MHASGNKDVQNYENYTLFTGERKLIIISLICIASLSKFSTQILRFKNGILSTKSLSPNPI